MGYKKYSKEVEKQLLRQKPRGTREYRTETNQYKDLIESFSKKDYLEYVTLRDRFYNHPVKMLEWVQARSFKSCVNQLAEIRVNDRYLHQKLVQQLKYRWTNRFERVKANINSNPDAFWHRMAKSIQTRSRDNGTTLHIKWQGTDGLMTLKNFLRDMYDRQQGICPISGESMLLQLGDGAKSTKKCSPDRIDSDRGYHPDNLWLVTWWVNEMKMDMSLDEFYQRIDIIHSHQKSNLTSK